MASQKRPFHSLYSHGFARVAACVPHLKIAEPTFNAERTIALVQRVAAEHAVVAVFPELGLSGYTCDDLFHQDAVLGSVLETLQAVTDATASLDLLLLVGAPLVFESRLFNCAVALHKGKCVAVVPKTYLPNYREFYEKRQFSSATEATRREIELLGQTVPFGSDIILDASGLDGLSVHAEICEDLWTAIAPSSWASLAGATVLTNLSASNITIGKAGYRRKLAASQSARCVSAYIYTAAGEGESTTDLAWDGHALIHENGNLLAESTRFSRDEQCIFADIDLDRLRQERIRLTSFNDSARNYRDKLATFRHVKFDLKPPSEVVPLRRDFARFPYVPTDEATRDDRCAEALNIQVVGLTQRLSAARINKVVIGVSGGLDSTLALIVCCRAMDRLKLPRQNILAYTMPGFATSDRTKSSAWRLMDSLGVTAAELDIRISARQMLIDIDHPFAADQPVHDVTFENVQAGERTSHLFRLANHHNAIVIGTGDLSELALGWNTYGVGDQMSHYSVNASVPKTLIQYLIRWQMNRPETSRETRAVLDDILNTEISPELVPAGTDGKIQMSEDTVGPYSLQDFHLYYTTRFGYRPSKVAFLALNAWSDVNRGRWPSDLPEATRRSYDLSEIKKWLAVFLKRFFATSQFKRSAMPNAPKVGSGGSLSPRGDWRAPSDSSAKAWLDELSRNVP